MLEKEKTSVRTDPPMMVGRLVEAGGGGLGRKRKKDQYRGEESRSRRHPKKAGGKRALSHRGAVVYLPGRKRLGNSCAFGCGGLQEKKLRLGRENRILGKREANGKKVQRL